VWVQVEDAYRSLAPAVLGYVRGQGADDPEDMLGEVFFHVARSLHRFKGDEAGLRRWIFTIAHNRVIDERRRRGRRPTTVTAALPDLPDVQVTPTVEHVEPALLAGLATLTTEQREVVLLRFIVDLSLEDVAQLTGRPVGAVKSMQHRALAQLARILAPARGDQVRDG
jgi:RNA polymerase sigma-70 factor (ECF subfamily)